MLYNAYAIRTYKEEVPKDMIPLEVSLKACMDDFQKYVDSIHDIMEHKFLVFICNPGLLKHWVTIVVVNPFSIFENAEYSETDKQAVG